jgi:hypothetical protein
MFASVVVRMPENTTGTPGNARAWFLSRKRRAIESTVSTRSMRLSAYRVRR